ADSCTVCRAAGHYARLAFLKPSIGDLDALAVITAIKHYADHRVGRHSGLNELLRGAPRLVGGDCKAQSHRSGARGARGAWQCGYSGVDTNHFALGIE